MKILSKTNKYYPKRLLKIKDAPTKLYTEGNYELLNKDSIAIVGTRNCTEYGRKYAKEFAEELSKNGMCIISGMAVGIDTIAHINSMKEQGKTIAVLGSGFNKIYPEENKMLFNQILENGGCVVSEYPLEEEMDKANFPKRNRIISGISLGTLVIEAKYRSGSTITAKYAIEQRKEVFCIPNRLDISTGYSTNLLIKNGANLVMQPEDILEFYFNPSQEQEVQEEYKQIYNLISSIPVSANELSRRTKKTISETMQTLTMLELEGYIKTAAGNQYIRT